MQLENVKTKNIDLSNTALENNFISSEIATVFDFLPIKRLCFLLIIIGQAALHSAFSMNSGIIGNHDYFGVSGTMLSYVDNLEYKNQFRVGETLLGAWAKIRLYYKPDSNWIFSAGVYGNRQFGDSRFFSDYNPLFYAGFSSNGYSFGIGEINYQSFHLPDLLFKSETYLIKGNDEGLKFSINKQYLENDTWISWYGLNTPEQREHFAFGDVSILRFKSVFIPVMALADHHGGQLYDPSDDPVRENYNGAAGIGCNFSYVTFLRGISGRIMMFGSLYRNREDKGGFSQGWGALNDLTLIFRFVDIGLQWYKGENFISQLGNPVYKTNHPMYCLQFSKKLDVNKFVALDAGLRFENFETDGFREYLKNPQYRWWISFRGQFDKPFRKM